MQGKFFIIQKFLKHRAYTVIRLVYDARFYEL